MTVTNGLFHNELVDSMNPDRPRRVLMVVANPGTSTTLGWPVGFWASELFHPFYEFTRHRYDIVIASPDGGRVEVDSWSDPRDEGKYANDDLISMGALHTTEIMAQLENTPKLADLDLDTFDALVVCGGQGPMFQKFRERDDLKATILHFFQAEKVTAALCHGVSALLDITIEDGSYLIAGRTITGFANVEEDFADNLVGKVMMPFRIEDAAKERGANFIQAGLWKSFAVRDGHLITGQQQYSGGELAGLVIEALGV